MADNTRTANEKAADNFANNSQFRIVARRLFRNKSATVGLCIFLLLFLLSFAAPLLTPHDFNTMELSNKFAAPSVEHLFGTDDLGRDVFARILYGGRYSLGLSVLCVGVSLCFGIVMGCIAGYFGGWVDNLIMRLMEILHSIPTMLLNVVMSAALGTGFFMTVLALSISRIPSITRMLRAQFLSVGEQEYVEVAKSMSVNKFVIIAKHILPNAISPLIVQSTMGIAATILNAAALSYIGLGIQEPTPEWGAMLSASRGYIVNHPLLITVPGIFIMITVLSINMFGDGLRDALDPKLKD